MAINAYIEEVITFCLTLINNFSRSSISIPVFLLLERIGCIDLVKDLMKMGEIEENAGLRIIR